MPDATHICSALTTFRGLDELGLKVVVETPEPDRAVLAALVIEPEGWCRRCGFGGIPCEMVNRKLAHGPLGCPATTLEVAAHRFRYYMCGHVWRQDSTEAPPAPE